jgi:hypothetical protein
MIVDCDAAGGAVISGLAPPGSALHLSVDDAAAGEAKADAAGWYSVALAAAMKPGGHDVVVQAGNNSVRTRFTSDSSRPLESVLFRGQRLADRWRIDWITPGGGMQTTYVLD